LVIIGFGNQAKAWALNLRDSGQTPVIAARKNGGGFSLAKNLGFPTIALPSLELKGYSTFALLTPDHTHAQILNDFKDFFPQQASFVFAHGYSLVTKNILLINPSWDHLLLAPKSIGSEVRYQYETKGNLGAVYSVEHSRQQKIHRDFILTLAKQLGINKGPYEVTIQDETVADLFSEQALLCSILPYLSLECFKLLRNEGISKELAYFELWQELKLIANTMVNLGPKNFFSLISPNALIGGQKGREVLLDQHFKNNLQSLLADIKNGVFFQQVEQNDVHQLARNVSTFWENEELEDIHQSLFGQHL